MRVLLLVCDCTSMLTKKSAVGDGSGLSECVELVEPFSGDVELQQTGLL